jgi:hypothetical protein
VKFSLISATSIFALLSASIGPAHSAVLDTAQAQQNIYDLVHDGLASSDGGDNTVTNQDPMVTAVIALEASVNALQSISFTGRIDQLAAAGNGYPLIPLGVARGAKPDEDLASATSGTTPIDAMQKARNVGQERLASLVGSVGNGPSPKDAPGDTVFIASTGKPSFTDAGGDADGASGPSVAYAFAPSSTSTATFTVAGTGNMSRQWAGNDSYVVAANSLQAAPQADTNASSGVKMAEAGEPTLGYSYAPAAKTAAKGNEVAASFSDAISATGNVAQLIPAMTFARVQTSQVLPGGAPQPGQSVTGRTLTSQAANRSGRPNEVMTSQIQKSQFQAIDGPGSGKVQTSQLQPGSGRPDQFLTSQIQKSQFQFLDATSTTKKPADLIEALLDPNDGSQAGDSTRTLISTSVSANPSETAATYMASVIRQTPAAPAAQSIEAFEVGPTPGQKTEANAGTKVTDPLQGKIMASAGPLNGALALP